MTLNDVKQPLYIIQLWNCPNFERKIHGNSYKIAKSSQTSIKDYSLSFALFELLTILFDLSYSNHLLSIKTSSKSDIIDKSYRDHKIEWLTFETFPDWVVSDFDSMLDLANIWISNDKTDV